MDWIGGGGLLCVAAVLVGAMWTDWRYRRIPHWMWAALLILWGSVALLEPAALRGTPMGGLICGAGGLALGFALYATGWLGGGDGKLLGATALWLSPGDFGLALLGASALLLVLWVSARASGGLGGVDFRNRGIPFACAFAPPTVVILGARVAELVG